MMALIDVLALLGRVIVLIIAGALAGMMLIVAVAVLAHLIPAVGELWFFIFEYLGWL